MVAEGRGVSRISRYDYYEGVRACKTSKPQRREIFWMFLADSSWSETANWMMETAEILLCIPQNTWPYAVRQEWCYPISSDAQQRIWKHERQMNWPISEQWVKEYGGQYWRVHQKKCVCQMIQACWKSGGQKIANDVGGGRVGCLGKVESSRSLSGVEAQQTKHRHEARH